MEPEFSIKQPKRIRPDTDYSACQLCQKGADSKSGPLHKVTAQGYHSLLYAVINRRDEISFRLESDVEPQSAFLEKNPVCHARCRSSSQTAKQLIRKKNSQNMKIASPLWENTQLKLAAVDLYSQLALQCHLPSFTNRNVLFVEKHAILKEIDHFFSYPL